MRIAFVIIEDFAFQAHQGAKSPLSGLDEEELRWVVLVEGEGGRAQIRSVSPKLRSLGVKPGMTVAEARARVGAIWSYTYHSDVVARESSKLGGLLLSASPQIRVLDKGTFWVGADGWRLLGGEETLLGLLRELIEQSGHVRPRIGVANTVIAARAAALFGLGIIPVGEDAKALSALPLSALPLEEATREGLWALGIRTVGAFLALPKHQLANRFGRDATEAHRLAQADDPRLVPLMNAPEPSTLEVDFETPFEQAEPAIFVLQGGMEKLLAPHRERGFGVQCLKLELKLVKGSWEREIRPADPVVESRKLVDMCRAILQDAQLPSMMEGVRAVVTEVSPAAARQEGVWANRTRRQTVTLDFTLIRLQSRLGQHAIRSPGATQDAHLPEQLSNWCEPNLTPRLSLPTTGGETRAAVAWRIKRCPTAVPIEFPTRIQFDGKWTEIARVVGPERIETGWWEVDAPANDSGAIRREYWYAELRSGQALAVFQDLTSGGWFLQGVMD